MIAANVIDAARRSGVEKLLYVASSAVYPQFASQPITEHALLTGPFDPSHEGYATAKIAGLKLVGTYRRQYGADFIAALPACEARLASYSQDGNTEIFAALDGFPDKAAAGVI